MHSHRLRLKQEEWLLQWDEKSFRLTDPAGELAIDDTEGKGYRHVDVFDLFCRQRVGFIESVGTFDAEDSTIEELRLYCSAAIKTDEEFRDSVRKDARANAIAGPIVFVVCGGPFILYCSWAIGAPDPPPGHWLRWAGPLISIGLLLLLAFALVGPIWFYKGLRILDAIKRLGAK